MRLETPGGGGYGDALTRNPETVRSDVIQGYVSAEAAFNDFGVIFKDSGTVEYAATIALRKERKV